MKLKIFKFPTCIFQGNRFRKTLLNLKDSLMSSSLIFFLENDVEQSKITFADDLDNKGQLSYSEINPSLQVNYFFMGFFFVCFTLACSLLDSGC